MAKIKQFNEVNRGTETEEWREKNRIMEGTKQNNGGNKTEKWKKLNRRTEGIKQKNGGN